MKGKILVTDSLFIYKEHEEILKEAGYEVERLDKPNASEEELVSAVKGKVGYILGGIEKITEPVIESADSLKAIVFTGTDPLGFIPAFDLATKNGITIANTPDANSFAVAEYTTAVILAMTRNLFELGRTGEKSFETTSSIRDLSVGIVGMGNIGSRVAKILRALGAKEILYFNRSRKTDLENELGVISVTLDELLQRSDVVTLHVPKTVGDGFIDAEKLARMKDGALIVNCGFMGGIDRDALLVELQSSRLRAAEDGPKDDRFTNLPLSTWYCSNEHTAYNTYEANKTASDMAVRSLLNLLDSGKDEHKVN